MHFDSIATVFATSPEVMAFMLLFAHCLGDFALQNDFVANAKNHNTLLGKTENMWLFVLPAHAMIHAGLVFLVTGSLAMATVEFFAHTAIDFAKCDKKFGFAVDQILHLLCKAVYVVIIFKGISL